MSHRTWILAGLLTALVAGSVRADYIGLVTLRDDGGFYAVDSASGHLTKLGPPITSPWDDPLPGSLTYLPDENRLYLTYANSFLNGFATVNPQTWLYERSVLAPFSHLSSLAYDSLRGRMLAASYEMYIWEIDRGDGSRVQLLLGNSVRIGRMVYVASDDALYMMRPGAPDALIRYDLATGVTTTVRDGTYYEDVGFSSIDGMAFNPLDGCLYAIDTSKEQLCRIDRATGELTPIGIAHTVRDTRTLAFIPEPATLGLLAVGGLAFAAGAVRRGWW